MNDSVRVTKNPTTGEVFTKNEGLGKDGKQYGYIRVQSEQIDLNGAVARVKTISALKSMTEEDFNKVKHVLVDGASLPGRIRTIESLEAGPGFQAKMAGSGENALPCLKDGKQIYRKTELCVTGEADELIAHTNGAEISAAAKAKSNIGLNS